MLVGLLAGIARAADGGFVLTGTDGKAREGSLTALAADGAVTIGDAKMSAGAWVALAPRRAAPAAYPDGAQLIFTNGDRLPVAADKVDLADDKLTLRTPCSGRSRCRCR